jgi:hypothetical protein
MKVCTKNYLIDNISCFTILKHIRYGYSMPKNFKEIGKMVNLDNHFYFKINFFLIFKDKK